MNIRSIAVCLLSVFLSTLVTSRVYGQTAGNGAEGPVPNEHHAPIDGICFAPKTKHCSDFVLPSCNGRKCIWNAVDEIMSCESSYGVQPLSEEVDPDIASYEWANPTPGALGYATWSTSAVYCGLHQHCGFCENSIQDEFCGVWTGWGGDSAVLIDQFDRFDENTPTCVVMVVLPGL